MSEENKFLLEIRNNIEGLRGDSLLCSLSKTWMRESARYKYSYNFTWLGRPIIQYPQDIVAMQEIVWQVKPELVIETGIAHGGSLIFYASLLELIGKGRVLGIDADIRAHNRSEIEKHPMFKRLTMMEGSSVDLAVAAQVQEFARGKEPVLVVLDSNHTHEHVAKELELYSPLVRKGSYLVVFDTLIEDMPKGYFRDRPWDKGNNPKTAVLDFLRHNDRFVVDREIEDKLLISVAPGGYLRCVRD